MIELIGVIEIAAELMSDAGHAIKPEMVNENLKKHLEKVFYNSCHLGQSPAYLKISTEIVKWEESNPGIPLYTIKDIEKSNRITSKKSIIKQ